jgi:predicted GTPase
VVKLSDMCLIVVDVADVFNNQNLFIIKNSLKLCKFNLVVLNKSDKIQKKKIIHIENELSKKFSHLYNFKYQFISSKYMFNLHQLFKRIERAKFIQKNISFSDILSNVKFIINEKEGVVSKNLLIKKIYIRDFGTLSINVILINKNVCDNYKRYLCALIIKHIDLKIFSFKFNFK